MNQQRMLPTAIIPVYRPDDDVVANVIHISRQVPRVIVIEDTGNPRSKLDGRLPRNVTLLKNDENLGQATSLNTGILLAMLEGAQRVVTFDQDTQVPNGYIDNLTAHLDQLQSEDVEALIAGPDLGGERGHSWAGGWCSLALVQSGLLFDVRVFHRVGVFRDEFVIDGVEQEFLLRLHRRGLHTSICTGLSLPHDVGQPRQSSFFGRQVKTTGHAPYRHYYAWRNHLAWMREYWREEPGLCAADLRWLLKWTIKASLFEEQPWMKLSAALRGVRDFLLGRFGKIDGRRHPGSI